MATMIDWNKFGDLLREYDNALDRELADAQEKQIFNSEQSQTARWEICHFIDSNLKDMIGDCYEIDEMLNNG